MGKVQSKDSMKSNFRKYKKKDINPLYDIQKPMIKQQLNEMGSFKSFTS